MRKAIKALWTAVKFAAVAVYGATLVVAAFVDLPVALVLAFPGLILVINRVVAAFGIKADREGYNGGYSAGAYAYATDTDGSFDVARAIVYDNR